MDPLVGRQIAFNATSREHWEAFGEHRRHLTEVLLQGAKAGQSRLCVLGAGNANDLELPALLAAHGEVHLVDIDADSLALGASRQGVAEHRGLRLHSGVDVTAALGSISGWTPLSHLQSADFRFLSEMPASRVTPKLPGRFDCVASTCLLSQIWETAAHALGRSHRQLAEVDAALVIGHLRLMAQLVISGGNAILVSEVVSSDTLPQLAEMSSDEIESLLPKLRREGNHFRGAHPQQLLAVLRSDAHLGPRLIESSALAPWRWRLHNRSYLVNAMTFRLRT